MRLALAVFVSLGGLVVPRLGAASVFDEFHGVRSTAMGGANCGLGTSNDTLYLNPAGMAVMRRYAVELNYAYSGFDDLTNLNVSVVDSKSSPVAGGLAYTHERGDPRGADPSLHRIYMATAYPISDAFAVGLSGHNIRGTFVDNGVRRDVALYSGDVGIITRLGQGIGLGVSAHNVVRTDLNRMTPLTFAGGVGWDSSPLAVAADFELDVHDAKHKLQTYRAGAEYLVGSTFPIRAGWHRAPYTKADGTRGNENALSVGGGWVSPGGMIAVGGERSLERPKHWEIVVTLGLFL